METFTATKALEAKSIEDAFVTVEADHKAMNYVTSHKLTFLIQPVWIDETLFAIKSGFDGKNYILTSQEVMVRNA